MSENSEQKNNNEKNENKPGLLGDVKSKYILKEILDNIKRNKKLNLIRYNEKLQNKLNIGIDDYFNAIIAQFKGLNEVERTPKNFNNLFQNCKTQLKQMENKKKVDLFCSINFDNDIVYNYTYDYRRNSSLNMRLDSKYTNRCLDFLERYFFEKEDLPKLDGEEKIRLLLKVGGDLEVYTVSDDWDDWEFVNKSYHDYPGPPDELLYVKSADKRCVEKPLLKLFFPDKSEEMADLDVSRIAEKLDLKIIEKTATTNDLNNSNQNGYEVKEINKGESKEEI